MELDKEKMDAWGIPVLKIHCAWGENELALREIWRFRPSEMLAAAGARNIEPLRGGDSPPGFPFMRWGRLGWGGMPRPRF